MKYVDPPFELGEKLQGVDDNGKPVNLHWLGQKFEIPAQRLSGGPGANKARWTGKSIVAVALRNISGIELQPKRLVQLSGTAGASTVTVSSVAYNETNIQAIEGVSGYPVTLAKSRCVIVDPFLPSGTTVADNEIFWGILEGRVLVKAPTVNTAFNGDIAVNAPLVAATLNTTSGNSTAGAIANVTLPGQTGATQAFSMAQNLIGYALSARTTNETGGVDVLVDACIKY